MENTEKPTGKEGGGKTGAVVASSALITSFEYELKKISERSSELEKLLNKIYSALDIRLGSDDVKKVLELKGMLDESARGLKEIKADIDATSQNQKNQNEEILALKQQNKKDSERIESMRNYILHAGPNVYDVVGLIGASALMLTSIFIYMDKWEIIRAWYYPMAFGILIAIAAAATIFNQQKLRKRLFGGRF